MAVVNLTTNLNCTLLATRSNFPDYIQVLRNETGTGINSTMNLTLLGFCRPEVCNTLWGTGNADISGIGVRFFLICRRANILINLDDHRISIRNLPRVLFRFRP